MAVNAVRIRPEDMVAVAVRDIAAGECALGTVARRAIPAGHKIALRDIAVGENILKYGMPIGHATRQILAGEWVHEDSLATNLASTLEYEYRPSFAPSAPALTGSFPGYLRQDGRVGIRNEIWILPTVGCVNGVAEALARKASGACGFPVIAFPHPYGCSQLGEDHARTQALLAALVRHPNAGGVLVLGLGCENNNIPAFRRVLGDVDESRVKFLSCQDVPDEMETGDRLIREIAHEMRRDTRTEQDVSGLVLGLKCGGSDGFSGITGNPLLGALSDGVISAGGSAILTEVPEMFGAETLLMARARNKDTFSDIVKLVNGFKEYFALHGQPVYENPSPGNRAGGITTLEEKSLGCTQKGGSSPVEDVLGYAERVKRRGLSLAFGPGNDICAVTALAAAGAQLVLFTTGRGTPLGSPVPVIKVATNSALAEKKPGWVDFDAGRMLERSTEDMTRELFSLVLSVAGGRETRSEIRLERQIAIFKDGVTL